MQTRLNTRLHNVINASIDYYESHDNPEPEVSIGVIEEVRSGAKALFAPRGKAGRVLKDQFRDVVNKIADENELMGVVRGAISHNGLLKNSTLLKRRICEGFCHAYIGMDELQVTQLTNIKIKENRNANTQTIRYGVPPLPHAFDEVRDSVLVAVITEPKNYAVRLKTMS